MLISRKLTFSQILEEMVVMYSIDTRHTSAPYLAIIIHHHPPPSPTHPSPQHGTAIHVPGHVMCHITHPMSHITHQITGKQPCKNM